MQSTIVAVLLTMIMWPLAHAQDYPVKPVRIIVPQPAGSTPDFVARLIAPGMSALFRNSPA